MDITSYGRSDTSFNGRKYQVGSNVFVAGIVRVVIDVQIATAQQPCN